jgi:dCMP deaminase
MTRPTIDEYYLGIAQAVSARAECTRRQIGAVIVRDGSIMGTGFNGAPPGEPSCLDGACPRALSNALPGSGYAQSGCVVIHAEANAIIRAGRERCRGATLYVTDECCELCAPLVRAAGIVRVVTPEPLLNSSIPGEDPFADMVIRRLAPGLTLYCDSCGKPSNQASFTGWRCPHCSTEQIEPFREGWD